MGNNAGLTLLLETCLLCACDKCGVVLGAGKDVSLVVGV